MKSFKFFKKWIFIQIILFCTLLCTAFSFHNPVAERGVAGIDASFLDAQGNQLHLSSLRGKVVVINYWASWCLPCLAEFPSLNRLHEELKSNQNIVFITINSAEPLSASVKFMDKKKYTLPVYQAYSSLPPELTTKAIPTTVILDKYGELVVKHVGAMNFKSKKFKTALVQLSEE